METVCLESYSVITVLEIPYRSMNCHDRLLSSQTYNVLLQQVLKQFYNTIYTFRLMFNEIRSFLTLQLAHVLAPHS